MTIGSRFNAYREQLIRIQAVLLWAGRHLKEGESLIASVEGFSHRYAMQYGRISKTRARADRMPAIIVCEPRNLSRLTRGHVKCWRPIFRSPFFEVWENMGRFSGNIPARHGLTKERSISLLAIARDVLTDAVSSENEKAHSATPKGLDTFAEDLASADVAVWIDGELRASMLVTNRPLIEAVKEAAARAARDSRFRPLDANELMRARLELTVWFDLEIPLLPSEIARGDIYHTKVYIARKMGKTGWYLPTVFNCVRFTSLADLLGTLASNKGGFSPEGMTTSLSEAQGWIEPSDGIEALELRGPVVKRNFIQSPICLVLPKIVDSAFQAAEQLVSLQETNGFIESVIDPFESYPTVRMQWARLAFCAHALAIFGSEFKNISYEDAAKRLVAYLSRHLHQAALPDSTRVLTEVYLGRAAQTLNLKENEGFAVSVATQDVSKQSYDPMLYLQSSLFLYAAGHTYRAKAEELYRIVVERFLRDVAEKNSLSLASYAELVTLAPLFADHVTTKHIEKLYKDTQLDDGSFPNTPSTTFAYSRGTAKIFEVMASDPLRYQSQLKECASWLLDMQYNSDNLYFVRDAQKRSMLKGGFRHDAGNQQAWIDASAHFIVGVARLRAHCLFG
jgi:AMMECR1